MIANSSSIAHCGLRRSISVPLMVLSLLAFACQAAPASVSAQAPPPPDPFPDTLTLGEVDTVVRQAAYAIGNRTPDNKSESDDITEVVAVVDRAGNILAVWEKPGAQLVDPQVRGRWRDRAVSLARTGAFFSNNQAPLSSRTVRFISGIHFPPGVENTQAADLYGIENTNRGCELTDNYINDALRGDRSFPRYFSVGGSVCSSTDPSGCSLGISTGKLDVLDSDEEIVNGAGLPLTKNPLTSSEFFTVVGGVGVFVGMLGEQPGDIRPESVGDPFLTPVQKPMKKYRQTLRLAEYAAACGAGDTKSDCPSPDGSTRRSFLTSSLGPGKQIFMAGIRLPFLKARRPPNGISPGTFTGSYVVPPTNGKPAPEGWLVDPTASADSLLSPTDVIGIVQRCVDRSNRTRAAIRLPIGSRARMVIAVGDLTGKIIGLFRMHDSTIFSVDVAVTKARNVVYFSGTDRTHADELPGVPPGTAMTNRSIEFGAEPRFPSGIEGTSPGPFFGTVNQLGNYKTGVYRYDSSNPCTQGQQPPGPNQSGIVFFPGALPLYRNGQMIGGLGVSGDGVDQDDYVTAGGALGFEAPASIRADQIVIDGVRLPYIKFPRNPEK